MNMLTTLKDIKDENREYKQQLEQIRDNTKSIKKSTEDTRYDIEDLKLEKCLLQKKCEKEIQELELRLEQEKYIFKTFAT